MLYPTENRQGPEVLNAFKLFVGTKVDKIQHFYCDGERSIIQVCYDNNIPQRLSQPGKPVTNTLIERANGDILGGAKAVIEGAGLPACFWSFGAPYYCFMENLTYDDEGKRLYELCVGEEFKGQILPFGAEVNYLVPDTRTKQMPNKWEGNATTGVFAGYDLDYGGKWTGLYLVWNLADFANMSLRSDLPATHVHLTPPK